MEEDSGPIRRDIAVLIPAYDPDVRLLDLLKRLKPCFARIVLVDDGSSVKGRAILQQAEPFVETILVHAVNRGKGAALKTGFDYLGAVDIVTADCDGQHTCADICRIADAVRAYPDGLVLGVRKFTTRMPFRSIWGGWWTRQIFRIVTGLYVSDTQTGLRGIPANLVSRIANLPGERYEFEMVVLADARDHLAPPLEIPIETIYHDGNAKSHFSPLRDTICIFSALFSFCRGKAHRNMIKYT